MEEGGETRSYIDYQQVSTGILYLVAFREFFVTIMQCYKQLSRELRVSVSVFLCVRLRSLARAVRAAGASPGTRTFLSPTMLLLQATHMRGRDAAARTYGQEKQQEALFSCGLLVGRNEQVFFSLLSSFRRMPHRNLRQDDSTSGLVHKLRSFEVLKAYRCTYLFLFGRYALQVSENFDEKQT